MEIQSAEEEDMRLNAEVCFLSRDREGWSEDADWLGLPLFTSTLLQDRRTLYTLREERQL